MSLHSAPFVFLTDTFSLIVPVGVGQFILHDLYLKENIELMSDLFDVPVPIVSVLRIDHNFVDKSLYPR